MEENTLKDYALITGASGGIGFELCTIMASKGHNLILVARSIEKLMDMAVSLSQKYKVKVHYYQADLTSENERIDLLAKLVENSFSITILVNNAGFGDAGLFVETNWLKTNRMIQLNVAALTHLTRELLPSMIRNGSGRILNVASIAGFMPGPLMSVYYATKSYVISFSEALNEELKGTGVRVTALCPGPVETNFFNYAGASNAKINKIMQPASAKSVALYGYKSMMKGKTRAIHGLLNKVMVFFVNFIPIGVSNPIVKRLHTQ